MKRVHFIVLLASFALTVSTLGQSKETVLQFDQNALDNVPAEKRTQLTKRLSFYVQSIKNGNKGKVYEVLATECRQGLSKRDWIRKSRFASPGRMQKIFITEVYAGDFSDVTKVSGEKWIAKGCGTYKKGRTQVGYHAYVSLVQIENDWFICNSGVAVEGKKDKPVPCNKAL